MSASRRPSHSEHTCALHVVQLQRDHRIRAQLQQQTKQLVPLGVEGAADARQQRVRQLARRRQADARERAAPVRCVRDVSRVPVRRPVLHVVVHVEVVEEVR